MRDFIRQFTRPIIFDTIFFVGCRESRSSLSAEPTGLWETLANDLTKEIDINGVVYGDAAGSG